MKIYAANKVGCSIIKLINSMIADAFRNYTLPQNLQKCIRKEWKDSTYVHMHWLQLGNMRSCYTAIN